MRARVVSTAGLRASGAPWLVHLDGVDVVVKCPSAEGSSPGEVRTEAVALGVAERCGVLAPRVVSADLTGDEAGTVAVVMTVLAGDAQIALRPDVRKLRLLGAEAAAIHQHALSPQPDLPRRDRPIPWIDFLAERAAGTQPTTDVLASGDAALASYDRPPPASVFVHGDLWQGNVMWDGERYAGTIDWEGAGAGDPGVDLGSLRFDATLTFGFDAARHVLAGWEDRAGRAAPDVAYWDLVAGLNTPADMSPFQRTMGEAGRTDLTGALLDERRDDFVRAALRELS